LEKNTVDPATPAAGVICSLPPIGGEFIATDTVAYASLLLPDEDVK
jgi:hypothetical protein